MIFLVADRIFVGLCCLQNSCRLFKKEIASLAYTEMFSVLVSALFKSGCFSKFSKYSLSTNSSPSNLRLCFFLSCCAFCDERFGRCCCSKQFSFSGFGVLVARDSAFSVPPIVFSIASWVFWTPKKPNFSILNKISYLHMILPNLKHANSGLNRNPLWKNIRLCSKFPRKYKASAFW